MNTNKQKGFTLIEVLIALLILAVGVLGIVALQFKGLKYSHDAYLRSQISFLAYDIADRMRLNQAAITANPAVYVANYNAGDAHAVCNAATGANAANDLACWYDSVDAALPPGSSANITGPVGGLYTVALAWTDRENQTHTINYTFQP